MSHLESDEKFCSHQRNNKEKKEKKKKKRKRKKTEALFL